MPSIKKNCVRLEFSPSRQNRRGLALIKFAVVVGVFVLSAKAGLAWWQGIGTAIAFGLTLQALRFPCVPERVMFDRKLGWFVEGDDDPCEIVGRWLTPLGLLLKTTHPNRRYWWIALDSCDATTYRFVALWSRHQIERCKGAKIVG